MAVRGLDRVVSTMSHSICTDGMLTELYRALLLLLTLLPIHLLPSNLTLLVFQPLPLVLRKLLDLSPRKVYVAPTILVI
jgi:hypothetical protein